MKNYADHESDKTLKASYVFTMHPTRHLSRIKHPAIIPSL